MSATKDVAMSLTNTIEPATRTMASSSTAMWRIRFVPGTGAGASILRQFVDPKAAVAIADSLDSLKPLPHSSWTESFDQLDLLVCPSASDTDSDRMAWLNSTDHADAPLPVTVSLGRGELTWRPGRAMVAGTTLRGESLGAIAEFAFYEAELRRLEEAVRPFEKSAMTDAAEVYRMKSDSKAYYARFGQTMEALAVLRLTFARLEPRLLTPSRKLPTPARGLIRRLSRRASIEDRLSAISDRLETCEDLYEGAVDRITDDRWYRRSNLLEIIIVLLLLIEVAQLGADMTLRWIANHAH
jgi:hypothetical protein